MPTKKEKLLKKLELSDALKLPNIDDSSFPRYIVKSLDKFEPRDWDVMRSVYGRAVADGVIKV